MIQNFSPVQYDQIRLQGGYDLLTPTLSLQSGAARDAMNFEVSVNGGYTRIAGYERVDGRPLPSLAVFSGISLSAVTGLTVGNTITTPTGSGVVIAIDGLKVFYTKATGTIGAGQDVKVGLVTIGAVTGPASIADAKTESQYRALAANVYRADIQEVPGSGPVRGVLFLRDALYAWRNNAGGTAMAIYKASPAGWTLVPLNSEIQFNLGTVEIFEGETITNGTATAKVLRVLVRTGTWASGNALGTLVIQTLTGSFSSGNPIRVGAQQRATATSASEAITLQPGGRVQTALGSFQANAGTRAYGCDGVNFAFEFDGSVYAPIRTGAVSDRPTNVAVHVSHLFLTNGASLLGSGPGEPYLFDGTQGAVELTAQDEITALQGMQGSAQSAALLAYSQNKTEVLYGTSALDFEMQTFSENLGARAYSVQKLDTAYSFDDRGVTSLTTTQRFGNFDTATLTYNIRTFLQSRKTLASASGVNRAKSQYRLFFSDGYVLYATIINGQYAGSMPVQFIHPALCWTEGEDSDGSERSYFGSSNGFVYALDSGTSFDGQPINYSLLLNYNSVKSPRLRKRFRRASIEMTGLGFSEFFFGYELGYGLNNNEQPMDARYQSEFRSAYWDSFTWDNFTWDGRTLSPTEVEMTGTAENVAIRISGTADHIDQFTLNSVILHYSMRRGLR